MKKLIFGSLVAALTILSISCDDSLNPYGVYKEKYVLNCILRADTTFQIATITTNYPADSSDPYSNTNNPFVKNAIVRIWNGNNTVEIMRDTTVPRPADSQYKYDYSLYYAKNFKPEAYTDVEIEAILPNGKRLTSKATTPDPIVFSRTKSDTLISSKSQGSIKIIWNTPQKNSAYAARAVIIYFQTINGVKVRKQAMIPAKYVTYGDQEVPIYSSSFVEPGYVISMDAFDKTMQLISDGDTNKDNYEILVCLVEVLSMDENLSSYYNSTARGADIYSVKLDETDFSNINGGFGIFGIYNRKYYSVPIASTLIYSYGYVPGLKSY